MDTISRIVRKALGPAAIIMPAWLLIGWTIFGHGVWGFIGLLIIAVIATVGLLIIAGLMYFRPSNRSRNGLDATETGLAAAIAIGLIWLGLWNASSGIGAAIAIVGFLAAFWYEVTAWMGEIRSAATGVGPTRAPRDRNDDIIDIGEITVVEEDSHKRGYEDTK